MSENYIGKFAICIEWLEIKNMLHIINLDCNSFVIKPTVFKYSAITSYHENMFLRMT